MIRSMTGFGAFEIKNDDHVVRAFVRSTNGKSLKITSRLNEQLSACEGDVEKAIRESVDRGSIYAIVEHEIIQPQSEYEFNVDAIKAYYNSLAAIQKELGCNGDIELSAIIPLPGTLSRKNCSWGVSPRLREKLVEATRGAVQEMIAMRETEGKALGKELLARTERLSELLADIDRRTPQMVEAYRDRLRERIDQLLTGTGISVDENDLSREVAVFAQRSDITEEISRIKSHVSQMRETLGKGGPMGRKLEFITQEMSREANTIASKASDPDILRDVVEIKAEVDRLREQVLNIE